MLQIVLTQLLTQLQKSDGRSCPGPGTTATSVLGSIFVQNGAYMCLNVLKTVPPIASRQVQLPHLKLTPVSVHGFGREFLMHVHSSHPHIEEPGHDARGTSMYYWRAKQASR